MTDKPLNNSDRTFIRSYGVHCWTRAVRLRSTDLPTALQGKTDQDGSFIRNYGYECWGRAIKLQPLSVDQTPDLGEREDPGKNYDYNGSSRVLRDGLPSPHGFREELV